MLHRKYTRAMGGCPPRCSGAKVEDAEWDCNEVEFVIVENGRTDEQCLFIERTANRVKKCLDGTGMCVIRGAVDKPTVEMLRSGVVEEGCHPDAAEIEETGKSELIQYTSGNGTAGDPIYYDRKGKLIGSYYNDLKKSTYLDRPQTALVKSLKKPSEDTEEEVADGRKYILLKYSKGAENYAHKDEKLEPFFPYQALLMLSDSDECDGGQFYVAKRSESDSEAKFVRTCAPKLGEGDLVIFQAAKEGVYSHGMKAVTRGERVAVGLLQKRRP